MAFYQRDFTAILYNLGHQYQLSACFASPVSVHCILNIHDIVITDTHIALEYFLMNKSLNK